MPNPFFKFKQFTIFQDRSAMKVCTDACLFGAWVASKFEGSPLTNILDIGTGTGLLSLMLAQKLEGPIESIEINQEAYLQAIDNITNSLWKEKIAIINDDVRTYKFTRSYALIISNPPFYENDLRSPAVASSLARHDDTLTLRSLLVVVEQQLLENGSFAVLVPYSRESYLLKAAAALNLYPTYIVNVRQSSEHGFFRTMVILTRDRTVSPDRSDLTIREDKNYSPMFRELLKDFYLYL